MTAAARAACDAKPSCSGYCQTKQAPAAFKLYCAAAVTVGACTTAGDAGTGPVTGGGDDAAASACMVRQPRAPPRKFFDDGPFQASYLAGCAEGCRGFADLADCQAACSDAEGCGGCTYEGWSNRHDWQWELRVGSETRASPFDEVSWIKSTGGVCTVETVEDRCVNGVLDAGEAAVDCGALCAALGDDWVCPDHSSCAAVGDCRSGRCAEGVCISCEDGVQNADESAVDCAAAKSGRGGQTCAQCADGAACRAASDCMDDSHCENGVCASCFNGVADGTESGVHCGGNTILRPPL